MQIRGIHTTHFRRRVADRRVEWKANYLAIGSEKERDRVKRSCACIDIGTREEGKGRRSRQINVRASLISAAKRCLQAWLEPAAQS